MKLVSRFMMAVITLFLKFEKSALKELSSVGNKTSSESI
jgi:hypothetical protein